MNIFISYRRAEDNKSYIVGTIHEHLAKAFGEKNVFRDLYDIAAGDDWKSVLDRATNKCNVMLVIIGPDWANLSYPSGEKRLFDPNDVTRWEVETGLTRSQQEKITIIPVLVMDAQIPVTGELPESIQPLLQKNVIRLRNYPDFNIDMEKLISDIRRAQGHAEDDLTTQHFEPKTIFIAEGPFWMGSPEGDGVPHHEVLVPAYRIGKYPVTNAQYEHFVSGTRKAVRPQMGWEGQKIPRGKENCPVVGVTWKETLEYCKWLSEKTGREYTLPNEAQWEKACRGGKGCTYPWGDQLDPARSNYGQAALAPVDKYGPQNDYNCFDFVGNVRQWTTTLWGRERDLPDPQYLRLPWGDDGRNDLNESIQVWRVVRGSSFKDDEKLLRCSARSGLSPESRSFLGGRPSFRVVMKAE